MKPSNGATAARCTAPSTSVLADTRNWPSTKVRNASSSRTASVPSFCNGWRGPNRRSRKSPIASIARPPNHCVRPSFSSSAGASSTATASKLSSSAGSNGCAPARSNSSAPSGSPRQTSGTLHSTGLPERSARSRCATAMRMPAAAGAGSHTVARWSSASSMALAIAPTSCDLASKLAEREIACTLRIPRRIRPRLTRSTFRRVTSSLTSANAAGSRRSFSWTVASTSSASAARSARNWPTLPRCRRHKASSQAAPHSSCRSTACNSGSRRGATSSTTTPNNSPSVSTG